MSLENFLLLEIGTLCKYSGFCLRLSPHARSYKELRDKGYRF